MGPLRLKRSLEYNSRVYHYAIGLKQRYRYEIADVFLKSVKAAEDRIFKSNAIGTSVPYLLLGQKIVLKEHYFKSGPATYCLIYEITDDNVWLISLWHGEGKRRSADLLRLWTRSDGSRE